MKLIEFMPRSPKMRFLWLSAVSFGLNLGLTVGLTELLRFKSEASFPAAMIGTFTVNFLALRYWVYGSVRRMSIIEQLAAFLASTFAFRLSEYTAFLGLHTLIRVPYPLTVVLVLATSSIVKFYFYKSAVFGPGTGRRAPASGVLTSE